MTGPRWSRRRLLTRGAGSLLLLRAALPTGALAAPLPRRAAPSPPLEAVAEALELTVPAVTEIAAAAHAADPAEAASAPPPYDAAAHADWVRRVRDAARADFREGRVRIVLGWYLAQTEVALCRAAAGH